VILLWGLEQDGPLSCVRAELRRSGAPFVFVDQRAVLSSEITLVVEDVLTGVVRVAGTDVDLASVSAAYVRPYDAWRIGPVARAGPGSPELRHALSFNETLWLWADLTPARLVNRPSAMARTSSKPQQAMTIARHGFSVPDTLITTDADAVRGFRARHGTVIYKSISGVRSIVSQLTPDHEGRLADVAWCPTQFQQYVPGADYRVHVAGSEVFCARIESVADDYRYGARQGAEMSMNAACLPDDWPQRCRALAADMGLALAGIDLRCTPDGEWYCFEVNPSPAFTYYDRFGQGIAGTVARLLTGTGASA
jgi:hypothetical protein